MEEHEKAIYAQMDSFHCVRERRVRGKEKRTHLYQINIYVFEWPQSTTPDDRQQMIESSRHIRYWSTWARRTKSRAVIWRKQWIWMKIADYTSLISWQIRKFSVHSNYQLFILFKMYYVSSSPSPSTKFVRATAQNSIWDCVHRNRINSFSFSWQTCQISQN